MTVKHHKIFTTFFKIGMFTLGGGYAMIPLIRREIVKNNQWIKDEEFCELLALAQSSPGPVAINSSVFVGYKLRGMSGSLTAALGTALPSFLIILAIAMYFADFRDNEVVANIFKGIRPAVVALIAAPLYSLSKRMKLGAKALLFSVLVTLSVSWAGISPVWVIIAAGLIGLGTGLITKEEK